MTISKQIIEDLRAWRASRQVNSVQAIGFFSAALRPNDRRLQQDLEELEAYLEILAALAPRNVAVEIGVNHGGPHFAWSRLFSEVISLDSDYLSCCCAVVEFPAPGSKFLYGDSRSGTTVQALLKLLGERSIDHLFFDGNHENSAVQADFLNYAPLVRSCGLIGCTNASISPAGTRIPFWACG
jgi:cephalosporin hydroxylase